MAACPARREIADVGRIETETMQSHEWPDHLLLPYTDAEIAGWIDQVRANTQDLDDAEAGAAIANLRRDTPEKRAFFRSMLAELARQGLARPLSWDSEAGDFIFRGIRLKPEWDSRNRN